MKSMRIAEREILPAVPVEELQKMPGFKRMKRGSPAKTINFEIDKMEDGSFDLTMTDEFKDEGVMLQGMTRPQLLVFGAAIINVALGKPLDGVPVVLVNDDG